jgi:pyruvate,water dikinase
MLLKGIAASPGVAEGAVRIVHHADDIARFEEGDVLVATVTEPSLIMMMNKAAAIVTDRGGITTHAAIVSRELGIPCVTATMTATKDLAEGVRVRVDGSAGTVEVL